MKLTAVEIKLLKAAVADGGDCVLSGIDVHPGANGWWLNAAVRLHNKKLGHFVATSQLLIPAFRINDAGRKVLKCL